MLGSLLFKGGFGSSSPQQYFAFQQLANGLHLAMHALTEDAHPLQSKLIFSQTNDTLEDNFLNVYEIYGLDLNAELAVLSACNTGYGTLVRGEGPASLAQAFAYAGCPSVVMSKWRADDAASSTLMIAFFNYLKEGMSKSAALQQAQADYLAAADPAHAHPYFWSNFSVIGSNKPLQTEPSNGWWWLLLLLPAMAFWLRKRIARPAA